MLIFINNTMEWENNYTKTHGETSGSTLGDIWKSGGMDSGCLELQRGQEILRNKEHENYEKRVLCRSLTGTMITLWADTKCILE